MTVSSGSHSLPPQICLLATFFFSCTADVWTGFSGAFGATFRLVPALPPCCQLAGKGRRLCQCHSGLLEAQISALPCRAGTRAAPWPKGQRGQTEQELLGGPGGTDCCWLTVTASEHWHPSPATLKAGVNPSPNTPPRPWCWSSDIPVPNPHGRDSEQPQGRGGGEQ